MTVINKGDLVLVTGASGYIAAWAVKTFLERGYKVRGTVRSTGKGEYLKNLFKEHGDSFEYVIVKDIGEDGAFDEAVKGVDAVAHMASPYHFNADDPEELRVPAVHGTTGILKSLQKNNPHCKRIVITSSVAAIMDTSVPPPVHFNEKHWNPVSVKECEEKGRNASQPDKYRASKTLAEQAFWHFLEEEQPAFEGVTINPPLVLGPIIHQVDSPEQLNTSVAGFYAWMSGQKTEADLPMGNQNFVDVRDCALAHVRALEVEDAKGQRFISSAGPFSANDYVVVCLFLCSSRPSYSIRACFRNLLLLPSRISKLTTPQGIHKNYPDLPNVPKGDASKKPEIDAQSNVFDGTKCTKVLGIRFNPIENVVEDMAKDLKAKFGP
ncbi:dihydrokaempferol 4-reductase [Naematelia encephala]|uniref:Dihydrokaempferol 4-reductase n=1 Tax=Naematelia encephala TaxID=71784 RepID=A0A1Y2BL25_9TREE|nr:dihydrokaempferol 4-reductase [Naematelia encephala]